MTFEVMSSADNGKKKISIVVLHDKFLEVTGSLCLSQELGCLQEDGETEGSWLL